MLVRYRGGEGMLAWAFHRISGVAIWLFVILHVIDIFLVGRSAGHLRQPAVIYATPLGHHGVAARRRRPVPRPQRPAHHHHGLLAPDDPLPPAAVVLRLGAVRGRRSPGHDRSCSGLQFSRSIGVVGMSGAYSTGPGGRSRGRRLRGRHLVPDARDRPRPVRAGAAPLPDPARPLRPGRAGRRAGSPTIRWSSTFWRASTG